MKLKRKEAQIKCVFFYTKQLKNNTQNVNSKYFLSNNIKSGVPGQRNNRMRR